MVVKHYPVVNGGSDLERLGYPYSRNIFPIQWGAKELLSPNYVIARHGITWDVGLCTSPRKAWAMMRGSEMLHSRSIFQCNDPAYDVLYSPYRPFWDYLFLTTTPTKSRTCR